MRPSLHRYRREWNREPVRIDALAARVREVHVVALRQKPDRCRQFGVGAEGVVGQLTSELKQAARRPLRVRLDCEKLRHTGAPAFRGVADGLRALGEMASHDSRERP